MNRFREAFVLAIVLIASCSGNYAENNSNSYEESASGYGQPASEASYPSAPAVNSYATPSYNKEVVPHSETDKIDTVSSSITYPQNKGEMFIHRPAAIVVKRPQTTILVKHAPLIVKPPPVIFHKSPSVVVRKVFIKKHPQSVKVHPVVVNVEKTSPSRYYLSEKQQKHLLPAILKSAYSAPEGYSPASYNAPSSYDAPASYDAPSSYQGPADAAEESVPKNDQAYASDDNGYKLVQGGDYSAYANIARNIASKY